MKYFAPLKLRDLLTLIVLIASGFLWIRIDQNFLPESGQRFIVFVILTLILFFLQFAINKPSKVWYYANTIALISFAFVFIVSFIMHIIIKHDFSLKTVLINLIVIIVPYITGAIYKTTRTK